MLAAPSTSGRKTCATRLAREGAPQVHGRRHRPGACASACAPRPHLRGLTRWPSPPPGNHLGVHAKGRQLVRRRPVPPGLISGDQMIAPAEPRPRAAHHAPAELRARERRRRAVSAELERIGLPLDAGMRGGRGRLHRRAALQLLGHRDEIAHGRSGEAARGSVPAWVAGRPAHASRRVPACVRCTTGSAIWASRARRCATRKRHQAYDIYLRGSSIGRPRLRAPCFVASPATSSTTRSSASRLGCRPPKRENIPGRSATARPTRARRARGEGRHVSRSRLTNLGRGALRPVRGEEPDGSRVGDRALLAEDRDLDGISDGWGRAAAHGL